VVAVVVIIADDIVDVYIMAAKFYINFLQIGPVVCNSLLMETNSIFTNGLNGV
jgi:hypothetical protein